MPEGVVQSRGLQSPSARCQNARPCQARHQPPVHVITEAVWTEAWVRVRLKAAFIQQTKDAHAPPIRIIPASN